MKVSTVLLTIVLSFFLMNITCNVGSEDPDKTLVLQVPFHNQLYTNYCGAACIQMWSDFDNVNASQTLIANFLGITPNGGGAGPQDLVSAVGQYTASPGHLATRPWNLPGAQGDLIGSTVEGTKHSVPSIIPYNVDHAVLAIGHKWREKADGTPFAIDIHYHDPYAGAYRRKSLGAFSNNFLPSTFSYWVILGQEDFELDGTMGHDIFVLRGGTYYGGPAYYNPKNLDLDPPEI
jgi:hypothetical protein